MARWVGRGIVAGGLLLGAVAAPVTVPIAGADPGVDGSLDTSWADDGIAVVNSGPLVEGLDSPAGMVVDSDGRLVVAITSRLPNDGDDIRLLRFLPDGTLDPTHGQGGVVPVQLGGLDEGAIAVAPAGDDQIVLAARSGNDVGTSQGDPVVALLDGDGALAPGFGEDGVVPIDLGPGPDVVTDVEVDSAGRVVVVGLHGTFPERQPSVLRLLADGQVDTTFGTDGLVLVETSGPTARAATIFAAIGAGDSVSVAGMTTPGGWTIFVGRYDATGEPDPSVGGDGTALLDGTGNNTVSGLRVDAAGRFHVSGHQSTLAGAAAFVARADVDGVLDPTYSEDGFAGTGVGTAQDAATDLAVLADGSVLVAGWTGTSDRDAFAARLDADGEPDATFGDDGVALAADASGYESSGAVALAGGRVYVSGTAFIDQSSETRIHAFAPGTGAPDTSWGGTGSVARNTNEIGIFDSFGALDAGVGGRLVLAGTASGHGLVVAVREATGQPDPSFAGDGLLTDAGEPGDFVTEVVALDDGRVLAFGGTGSGEALVLGFTAAGDPDPAVGGTGRATTTFGTGESTWLWSATATGDGHYLVSGALGDHGLVARLTSAGEPDATFGSGGAALIDADPGQPEEIAAVAIAPGGRIVAAGGGDHVTVARLLDDGNPDPTFGTGGSVLVDAGGSDEGANGVVLLGDRIVVGGRTFDESFVGSGVVFALTDDGTPDPGFNGGAPLLDSRPGESIEVTDVVVDGNRVLASLGRLQAATGRYAGAEVAAYTAAGSLDPGFGTGGRFATDGYFTDLDLDPSGAAAYAGGHLRRDMQAVKLDVGPPAPLPVVRPGLGGIEEGDDGTRILEVPVTLSAPSASTVTVDYQTTGAGPGIAEADVDYESVSGTLTFDPGETTLTVPIAVIGDRIDEPPALYGEWIAVAFSNVSATATLDTSFFGLGLGIIVDDDPPPTIRPGVGAVVEGDDGSVLLEVPVTLSNPSAVEVTVDWRTLDIAGTGLAATGADFTAASGTVVFAPGQTAATVQVPVLGDSVPEPPLYGGEWLLVQFEHPSPSATLDTATFFGCGIGIIFDDD